MALPTVVESSLLRPDQAIEVGDRVICGDAEAFWRLFLAELPV